MRIKEMRKEGNEGMGSVDVRKRRCAHVAGEGAGPVKLGKMGFGWGLGTVCKWLWERGLRENRGF